MAGELSLPVTGRSLQRAGHVVADRKFAETRRQVFVVLICAVTAQLDITTQRRRHFRRRVLGMSAQHSSRTHHSADGVSAAAVADYDCTTDRN